MRQSSRWLSVMFAALLLASGRSGWAACTDAAAPGVNWRGCLMDAMDLREVDLTGADIANASFKRADLTGARLAEVKGRRAKFVSAVLAGADLSNADLRLADFTSADLTGAVLVQADLRAARFFKAVLRDADFTGARLERADLLHADLSGARWVDGKTICAEGSIGRCRKQSAERAAARDTPRETEPSP